MFRADHLTTFMCRLSWNLGTSTFWNPQGLPRHVMGLRYLFTGYWTTWISQYIINLHEAENVSEQRLIEGSFRRHKDGAIGQINIPYCNKGHSDVQRSRGLVTTAQRRKLWLRNYKRKCDPSCKQDNINLNKMKLYTRKSQMKTLKS